MDIIWTCYSKLQVTPPRVHFLLSVKCSDISARLNYLAMRSVTGLVQCLQLAGLLQQQWQICSCSPMLCQSMQKVWLDMVSGFILMFLFRFISFHFLTKHVLLAVLNHFRVFKYIGYMQEISAMHLNIFPFNC